MKSSRRRSCAQNAVLVRQLDGTGHRGARGRRARRQSTDIAGIHTAAAAGRWGTVSGFINERTRASAPRPRSVETHRARDAAAADAASGCEVTDVRAWACARSSSRSDELEVRGERAAGRRRTRGERV